LGKTPLRNLKAPLGRFGNEDRRDLPLQLPPAAPKVGSSSPSSTSVSKSKAQVMSLNVERQWDGGFRLPIIGLGNSCRLSLDPLALQKLRWALATTQTVDGPSLWMALHLLSTSLLRISRRTGPGPQTPATAIFRTVRENPALPNLMPPFEKAPR
jgi:hypothetical protein